MKDSKKTIKGFVFGGAFLFVVLLCLAPRLPWSVDDENQELKTADARVQQAVELVQSENPMQGIRLLQDIVKEEPDNIEAQMQLGLFSMTSGQWLKAKERFSTVLELDEQEKFSSAHYYLARAHESLGEFDQAIASFTTYKQFVKGDDEAIRLLDQKINELKTKR